jgi:hypothetical protein
MTTERSTDELMADFNDKAKAQGSYDGRAFWEVPPRSGSLLDVPETPESRERIEWLKRQIAELRQGAVVREKTGVAAESNRPAESALEEQPPATNRV